MVFVAIALLLMVVREQRVQDLAMHTAHVAKKIGEDALVRAFIQDQPQSPTLEEVEQDLFARIDGDPFIEELSILSAVGKMEVRVARPREEPPLSPIRRSSPSLTEILATGQPMLEESGEYFIPLEQQNERWGVLRARWQPEATELYFDRLKNAAFYFVVAIFILSSLLVFWLLRITYDKEQQRLAAELRVAVSANTNYQIDPQTYSSIMAEIGAYINRLQSNFEDAHSKSIVLDDALRQAERGCADSRKSLELNSQSMESMRKEMRDGLNTIFEMSWSSVLIIDQDFQIHYINKPAERLLNLIQREKDVVEDERIRRCLAPMTAQAKVDQIDDLCAWPQPRVGRSISCRIRASKLPSVDSLKLFIILLKDESGYPSALDSSYFSERVLRDLISPRGAKLPWLETPDAVLDADVERRFKTCLKRIVFFHDLEQRKVEPLVSVRFSRWLRERFLAEDLFSEHLNLNVHTSDADISLCIPEKSATELIDCLITLLGQLADYEHSTENKPIDMFASTDSHGRPVLTLSTTCVSRKRALWMQDVLDDQCDLLQESQLDEYTLDRLERDVCFCIYRSAKDLLRVKVETVYSDNKHIASVHVVFPNGQSQPRVKGDDADSSRSESVDQLMRTYFRPS